VRGKRRHKRKKRKKKKKESDEGDKGKEKETEATPPKEKQKRSRYRSKAMLERAAHNLYRKAVALTKNAQNALINHLVKTYDTIIIPEFMTLKMCQKRRKELSLPRVGSNDPGGNHYIDNTAPTSSPEDRLHSKLFTLAKKTRVSLQRFAHYSFRQRLFAKAKSDPTRRKDVLHTTEEYTTKQCPKCHVVHHAIGSNEVFDCPKCDFHGDRDCVGSFNIGVRSLTKEEVREVTHSSFNPSLPIGNRSYL
jgi:transposase